jgi:putative flippase GtrA
VGVRQPALDLKATSRRFATPFRFVLAGTTAALANFAARIALSAFLPFGAAIVIAFFIGLGIAFVLNRQFVFPAASSGLHQQLFWFVVVNLVALAQTLAISLFLARVLLPLLAVTSYPEEIAHATGIVVPIFTSYLGHKYWTFR